MPVLWSVICYWHCRSFQAFSSTGITGLHWYLHCRSFEELSAADIAGIFCFWQCRYSLLLALPHLNLHAGPLNRYLPQALSVLWSILCYWHCRPSLIFALPVLWSILCYWHCLSSHQLPRSSYTFWKQKKRDIDF